MTTLEIYDELSILRVPLNDAGKEKTRHVTMPR